MYFYFTSVIYIKETYISKETFIFCMPLVMDSTIGIYSKICSLPVSNTNLTLVLTFTLKMHMNFAFAAFLLWFIPSLSYYWASSYFKNKPSHCL